MKFGIALRLTWTFQTCAQRDEGFVAFSHSPLTKRSSCVCAWIATGLLDAADETTCCYVTLFDTTWRCNHVGRIPVSTMGRLHQDLTWFRYSTSGSSIIIWVYTCLQRWMRMRICETYLLGFVQAAMRGSVVCTLQTAVPGSQPIIPFLRLHVFICSESLCDARYSTWRFSALV